MMQQNSQSMLQQNSQSMMLQQPSLMSEQPRRHGHYNSYSRAGYNVVNNMNTVGYGGAAAGARSTSDIRPSPLAAAASKNIHA